MPELLIEFLSEEIPARMQADAEAQLETHLLKALAAADVAHGAARRFSTPRRLAVAVADVAAERPARSEERKGPRVGAPEQAVAGFLRSAGLAALDQCEVRTVGKADFHFAVTTIPGGPTRAVLLDLIKGVLDDFAWPKSMRWGAGRSSWVRPLTQIVCVFDGEALSGEIDFGGCALPVGGETLGHSFLAPGSIAVVGAGGYLDGLRGAKVLADRAERRDRIAAGASAAAQAAGLALKSDPGLLDEAAGLVEWPVPLLGRIDDAFMDLPPEVLVTAMRTHQKYFAVETADGALANRFVVIANVETADDGAAITAGNERVLRARLSDARFFWDQDRARPLAGRVDDLAPITFHAKLGTVKDRAQRLAWLSRVIAEALGDPNADLAERAGLIAKADLTTGMVGEFPELQGLMGMYYAQADSEPAAVADALARQYQPAGPGDAVPTGATPIALALADKIDALVGFVAIDEKPTGSKDPYALRRAALGVIRIVLENKLRLALTPIFAEAAAAYAAHGLPGATPPADLLGFVADRLKVALKDQGVRHDRIAAAFACPRPDGGAEDDLLRLQARVSALSGLLDGPDGADLLAGYRRAANILRIEEEKDGVAYSLVDGATDDGEVVCQTLVDALITASADAEAAVVAENFTAAVRALASLRAPLDAFFDGVRVNDDDPAKRVARLRLLAGVRSATLTVADFAKIEG